MMHTGGRATWPLAAMFACIVLAACGSSRSSVDDTLLLDAEIRDVGQEPPNWMLLTVGNVAYANPLTDTIACGSVETFKKYNETKDDTLATCHKVDSKVWLVIRSIIPQGKDQYVVGVSTSEQGATIQYMGAGELSPNIPNDTELVVMNVSNGSSSDPNDTIPELVDQKELRIGTMLDHTRVRVRGLFPDLPTTYVAVTVLSGDLKGRDGYVDLDDLNSTTGDDDLAAFLGSAKDTASVTQTVAPSAPLVPTHAELLGAVQLVFKRGKSGPNIKGPPIFSPAFLNNAKMAERVFELFEDKAIVSRIDDIRGRVADLTETYVLTSDKKAKFHFTRHDTWTFVHGSGFWLLDTLSVNSKSIEYIEFSNGLSHAISDSRYDPASGKIFFSSFGVQYAWVPRKDLGWSVAILSMPTTAPGAATGSDGTTNQQPAASDGQTGSTGVSPENRSVGDPYDDCSTESIESVSDDGAVIKLLDGRRFLIRESDRYLTSIWLAADDVTVCDPGPGVSVKLIHESDVVHGGHLE